MPLVNRAKPAVDIQIPLPVWTTRGELDGGWGPGPLGPPPTPLEGEPTAGQSVEQLVGPASVKERLT